jgi:hypothetical protein
MRNMSGVKRLAMWSLRVYLLVSLLLASVSIVSSNEPGNNSTSVCVGACRRSSVSVVMSMLSGRVVEYDSEAVACHDDPASKDPIRVVQARECRALCRREGGGPVRAQP